MGPPDVMSRLAAVLGHVGAWAPRAEQVATAALLDDPAAVREYQEGFIAGLRRRLGVLHDGIQSLRAQGLAVDSMAPMGAIYLAARVHPFGQRTGAGALIRTNEDVRRFLLESAGIAAVPFQAFGSTQEDGWFRLSVGAVGEDDGFVTFRLELDADREIGESVAELARKSGWALRSLRRDDKSLEQVFRDLTETVEEAVA